MMNPPPPQDPMRYAFIGLGHLGKYLAANLLRGGFPLAVHDLDPAACERLAAAGARVADSAADAARGADAAITCLPSPAATREVLESGDGVLAGLAEGTTWIEMSTNDPAEIQSLAEIAGRAGIRTLEAPVTGGVHRAATGEITVLAGGPQELFEAHRPALAAMGGLVFHIGELGKASVIKVITNMLAFLHLVGAGEALALAKQSGIDLGIAFEAIRASSGNSFVHETESQVILNGSYDIGFTLDLACKDAGLAAMIGERSGVPLVLASKVRELLEEARRHYGGDAWSPEVVRLLEEKIGTELRAPGFPATLEEE